MCAFRPTRSSPPARASHDISESVSAASLATSRNTAPAPELTGLTTDDVELLDAIIARAGEAATTFLTVFKAYNDILQERGLDPHEVVYYGKLLKLGTLKGRNWVDKWAMVKKQHGYRSSIAAAPTPRPSQPPPPAQVPRRPMPRNPPPPVIRDDDSFTVHSHDNESVSEASFPESSKQTPSYLHPALARARARQRQPPPPPHSDVTSNSLGLDFGESVSAAPIPRIIPRTKAHLESETSGGETADFFAPPSTTPPSYRAAARDILLGRQSADVVPRSKVATSTPRPAQKPIPPPPKPSVINDDDAWKKIRMAQDEKDADEYYRLRLIERCWDIWKQGFDWIITTHEQIQEARENLLLRLYLQRWRDQLASHQQLLDNVAVVADRRRLKAAFSAWKKRLVSKQHANWRDSMRSKMKIVRKKQEQRLRKDAWSKWRQSYQSHLSDQHFNKRFVLRIYQRWKERLIAVDRLEDAADQVLETGIARVAETCWNHWRRMAQLRIAERAISQRVGYRLKRQVMTQWQKQMHDLYAADEYFDLCLLKNTIRKWKQAVADVRQLERRADRHIARQDDVLLRAVARVWKARERGRLLMRVKSKRLLEHVWLTWTGKLQQQRQREDLASRFSAQSFHLAVTSFQKWRQILSTHRNANEFAIQRHSVQLTQRMMLVWRIRWHEQFKLAKKARLLEAYLLMRRSLSKMKLLYGQRRLDHKLENFNSVKSSKFFRLWQQRAQRSRQFRLAEEQVSTRIAQRILRSALTQWTNRVIDVKLQEIEVKQHYEVGILMNAYNKWKRLRTRVEEDKSLMLSYRAVKDEDLTRRAFHHWLTATRAARHRKLLLKRLEDEKQLSLIVGAWEQWREKFKELQLRPLEYQLLFQAHKNELRNAMDRWKARTKSVPAIHYNASRIKAKFWKIWVEQMPRAQLAKKARDLDRRTTLARYLENWLQAYRTKLTRKAVDRARLLRLPTASTPRPAPSRPEATAAAFRNIFPARRPLLPEREAGREQSPSPPPRPFASRKPLFSAHPRSETSPPRSRITPPTRDTSPAGSSRSALAPRPRRAFPAPPSTVSGGGDEPSKLWLELREIRNRSKPSSEQSRGRRSP
ncbi:hypothetical protein BDZ89DRAFT_1056201 [Hymenopellis radicata]|nr:hypothetical protein BDZ89DRAFT_1056201 [Hymenopellis radicata]